jgi:integrase
MKSKRRKRPSPPPIALTKEELRTLFLYAIERDYVVYVLMLLHYHHAGRNSEMIHLTRDNFSDGRIKYKRGKDSEPCGQKLRTDLDPLFDETRVIPPFLSAFSGKQRLYPKSRWTYWRHVVKLALGAGLPRHQAKTTVLKHSIVTHVIAKHGFNVAQRIAGHVNGASTLRYGRLSEEQVDTLLEQAAKH